jgi:GH15 family glucan-1,4-alpha-glucosidase
VPEARLEIARDTVQGRLRVREGERIWLMLSHGSAGVGHASLETADPEALLAETLDHWREWDALCTYHGPYRDQVRTSARVLKLLTYGPTGSLVAAPTTSLPEHIRGVRNWDYRFCWLRDASLVLDALMSIGYHEAAMDFFRWLEGLGLGEAGDLQIMYRLNGGRELTEVELRHLSGYRGSAPVRVGNAATRQKQLDAYGHVIVASFVCLQGMQAPVREGWLRLLAYLADQACMRWREPDQGFWEMRCEPRHFVSSKLMCWVALDRALRLAGAGRLHGNLERWRAERDAIRQAVLEQGYNREVGAFTQVLGGRDLDATALLLPLVGFLPPSDARVVSTVERIRERLTSHGLLYRYLNEDGVSCGKATFAICSFWMVDNLALQGRVDDACSLFERVTSFGGDLGLLSEEIDPTAGELLGNYPQGFTHLALIRSALNIERARHDGKDA